MTWRMVVLLLLLALAPPAVLIAFPAIALASHAPAGSGACDTHDTTCYPECRAEWGAVANGGVPLQPVTVESAFCPVGPEYDGDGALVRIQSQAAAVNVGIASSAITVPVAAYQLGGEVFEVTCATANDCGAVPVSDVRVINSYDEPVEATVAGTTPQGWYLVAALVGLGAGVPLWRFVLAPRRTL